MNRRFKLISSHYRIIGSLVFIFSRYVVALLLFSLIFHFDWIKNAIVYIPIIIFGLFDLVPAIVIWVQYLFNAKSSRIEFDIDHKKLLVFESSNCKSYDLGDIDRIEFVFSFGGDSGVYSFGEFYYWKIVLKSEDCLYLTNFLCTRKIYSEIFEKMFPNYLPVPKLYPFLPFRFFS